MFERGMLYISELLEIKNIMKKICIDNMKYSLDYDELKRRKLEETEMTLLSLTQAGNNVPFSYLGKGNEREKIEGIVSI